MEKKEGGTRVAAEARGIGGLYNIEYETNQLKRRVAAEARGRGRGTLGAGQDLLRETTQEGMGRTDSDGYESLAMMIDPHGSCQSRPAVTVLATLLVD